MKRPALLAATFLLLVGCGSSPTPGASSAASSSSGAGGAGGAGAGGGGTGGAFSSLLDALGADLRGDFDDSAQHGMGLAKLFERHVCTIPGRAGDEPVLWLYVEEVDDSSGKRDTYSSRVNEIRVVDGKPVARIYKLVATHPLAVDPYKLDGARDGCSRPEILQAITDADLLHRDGCDLTFLPGEGVFQASTADDTCAVPGGFLGTVAVVSPDGFARTDTFHDSASKKSQPLSTFDFVRVKPAP